MEKTFTNRFGQKQNFNATTFGDWINSELYYDDRDCSLLINEIRKTNGSVAIFSEGFTGAGVKDVETAMQRAFYANRDNFRDSHVGTQILINNSWTLEEAVAKVCKYVDNYLALLVCSGKICDVLSREHYLPEENGGPNGGLVAVDLEEKAGTRHMTVITLEDKRGENSHRFALLQEDFDRGLKANENISKDDPCTKFKLETYFYCNKTNNFNFDDNRYLCDINGDFLKRVIKIY